MGAQQSGNRQQSQQQLLQEAMALKKKKHNAALAESLFGILTSLSDVVEEFQTQTNSRCEALKKIEAELKTLIQGIGNASTSAAIKNSISALKKTADEVLRQLGKTCCKSTDAAEACAWQAAPLLKSINELTERLTKSLEGDATFYSQ